MQLTGEEIITRCIINKFSKEGVQPQGVDVRIAEIHKVEGQGLIPKEGKTRKSSTQPIPTIDIDMKDGVEHIGWFLTPGYYEVTFMEGCRIPNDAVLHYDPRSSLVRCGGQIFSGQFDGGFETEHMGAFMKIELPIMIEQYARVAQARVETTTPVLSNLYNGQWQGDVQRNK